MSGEMIEQWDWDAGVPSGMPVLRSKAHREGIPHEGVHLWIVAVFSGEKYLLFQRRAPDKEYYPGYLDITVGGHVVFGQTEGKIQKEAREELGLDVRDEQLVDLGYFRYEETVPELNLFHREFQRIWLMRDDRALDQYRFADGEVDAIAAVPADDFRKLICAEHSFLALFFDGTAVSERILSRSDFHPLFFTGPMRPYLDRLFRAIDRPE
ncbi:MAG: NUDIX hydrolase [Spirochaetota bacterium]